MDKTKHSSFYVYALLRENGVPFYIGKGHGKRWHDHAVDARMGKRGYRFHIIRDMLARGVEMPKVRIHEGLTEAVAHEYEIALIKVIGRYPNGPLVNMTDGGEGLAGYKPSPEARAKMSAAGKAKPPRSPETRAKLSEALRGRKQPAEEVSKRSAAMKVNSAVLEHLARLSAAQRGKKPSPETLVKMSLASKGRRWTPERIATFTAAQCGKPRSPETRAKLSVANLGKKQSPELVAKRTAGQLGKPMSPEARANMSVAKLGTKFTPEHRANLSVAKRREMLSPETLARMSAAQRSRRRAESLDYTNTVGSQGPRGLTKTVVAVSSAVVPPVKAPALVMIRNPTSALPAGNCGQPTAPSVAPGVPPATVTTPAASMKKQATVKAPAPALIPVSAGISVEAAILTGTPCAVA